MQSNEIGRAEDYAVRGSMTPEWAISELKKRLYREIKRRNELGYIDP